MNCIYSLACFCSDTNDILNKLSCFYCTWFQYLLYKFRGHRKLHLDFHPINICIRIPCEILKFLPSVKVGLPFSKKIVIFLIERPLTMMKNAFDFIFKALLVLKIFKFLSRLFGLVGKMV